MPNKVPAVGPCPAKIMIVGEAPGEKEEESGKPFIGTSGLELTRMLNEAGIDRSACYVTNTVKFRPPGNDISAWIDRRKKCPDPSFTYSSVYSAWVHPYVRESLVELESEVLACQPNVIIAAGNTALSALSGENGIGNWRGSVVESRDIQGRHFKVVPVLHPASILRQWSERAITVHDLRRARKESDFPEVVRRTEQLIIRPSFQAVVDCLRNLREVAETKQLRLAADIETRGGQIGCIGIAWSKSEAICIPILKLGSPEGYWSREEEVGIILALRELLIHRNVLVAWQNGIYDQQYITKLWGFVPNHQLDTLTTQHVLFPGTPKDLSYQASMYCDQYFFWKEDGKYWDPKDGIDEEKHWIYNARDCAYTWEIAYVGQPPTVEAFKHKRTEFGTPLEIQYRMHEHVFGAMLRGVRFDDKLGAQMLFSLQTAVAERQQWINTMVGRELNVQSPKQLQELFYGELGLKPHLDRKTKRPTTNADALDKIARADPVLRPLCGFINDIRQLKNSISVILQPKDADGRIRCSYNISGTETYRFSSSEDAFGFGTNLQNITSGDEPNPEKNHNPVLPLPNLRKLFVPDPGHTLGDFDLPQADARVVAWDADDTDLMAIFNDPKADLHTENAKAIFGACYGKDDPRRQRAKAGVHAVNYMVQAPTLAAALGITVHEADKFIKLWFAAHPKIKKWHERIIHELQTRRYVENIFGYRRYYFDRIEGIAKDAVAWIGQSTVAVTTNLGIDAVCRDGSLRSAGVQLLLQVHDSAVFQWPTCYNEKLLPRILERLTIRVPYARPLIMPPGCKASTVSWGHCK